MMKGFSINTFAAYIHLLMSIGALMAAFLFAICPDIHIVGRIIGVVSGVGGFWSFGLEYKELIVKDNIVLLGK